MADRSALIIGITGMDGTHLAEHLLDEGYIVYGLRRRASSFNTWRIDHILRDRHDRRARLFLHYGDITDGSSLTRILLETRPSEIYNMAAQSHVAVSFETPEYSTEVDAVGPLKLFEAVRLLKMDDVRIYQASTSEMFGSSPPPQNEHTPFCPRSPYAVAKLSAYWTARNYREAYGLHISNGICFNHTSPLRGENFVCRKITRHVAQIHRGARDILFLGNVDAVRDWGWAPEYCDGMRAMVRQERAGDYVLATGKACTVERFCDMAFASAGYKLEWINDGARDIDTGREMIRFDPAYRRPLEVERLCGDATKARLDFGWQAKVTLPQIVKRMIAADVEPVRLAA